MVCMLPFNLIDKREEIAMNIFIQTISVVLPAAMLLKRSLKNICKRSHTSGNLAEQLAIE
jgi:hypothetical protein